jgi:glycosyltransferase involved in cell wall biosynthesis
MNRPNLAIVIPYFKINFLNETLRSISNQTVKNFTLYIGDDCSPDNPAQLIKEYENEISIVYKRFETNLGGTDLVSQWERCIALTQNEEWIWLFSDDDVMKSECVERFISTLGKFPHFDLYHFNVTRINEEGKPIDDTSDFPDVMTVEELAIGRLTGKIHSTVVEYVFRKTYFRECGGFFKFDLAWCSDDSAWIRTGHPRGIKNVEGGLVYWRKSAYNISPNFWNENIYRRKLMSEIEFSEWLCSMAKEAEINLEPERIRYMLKDWFTGNLKGGIRYLTFRSAVMLASNFFSRMNFPGSGQFITFLIFYKIFKHLTGITRSIYTHK